MSEFSFAVEASEERSLSGPADLGTDIEMQLEEVQLSGHPLTPEFVYHSEEKTSTPRTKMAADALCLLAEQRLLHIDKAVQTDSVQPFMADKAVAAKPYFRSKFVQCSLLQYREKNVCRNVTCSFS